MPKTKTVQEQTIHGSIEYSVIECDSCGQDVMEGEANEFTLGGREGYACDVCVDEGPVGFPEFDMGYEALSADIFVGLAFPLTVLMMLVLSLDEGMNEKTHGWVAGAVGGVLWATLGTLVVVSLMGFL